MSNKNKLLKTFGPEDSINPFVAAIEFCRKAKFKSVKHKR